MAESGEGNNKPAGQAGKSASCEKRSQKNLKKERQYWLQALVDNSADAAFMVDEKANFVYANRTASERYGYSPQELLTMSVFDLSPKMTHEAWPHFWTRVRQEKSFSFENCHVTRCGERIDVEILVNHFEHKGRDYSLAFTRDISERKRHEAEMTHVARHDSLTGLPNRSRFMECFAEAIKVATSGEKVAALFLDLDNFKQINDALGHKAGDELLKWVAERLRSSLRAKDLVARFGGDEFVVLLPGITSRDIATTVAQQLIKAFTAPFVLNYQKIHITTSVGISIYPDDGNDPGELLRQADMAMYRAKNLGRDRYKCFELDMNRAAQKSLQMEEQLRQALGRDELYLCYQPVFDLKAGRLVGAEALLRWKNQELGNVPPLEFIPIAEQSGMILSIGDFVLSRALHQLQSWQEQMNAWGECKRGLAGREKLKMSVNVSARQLAEPDFTQKLKALLWGTGVSGSELIVEVTESVLLTRHSQAEQSLRDLAELKIQLAMDDFGTGYSSLTYLRDYPFGLLKIDKDFVDGVVDSRSDNELVRTSIAMAQSLGLRVIAEGVEQAEQGECLAQMHADWVQGYHYSRPLAAQEFTRKLEQGMVIKRCP